jgi:hypothetical protein
MAGRKCALSPATIVEAIILFKDRVVIFENGK